MAPSTDPEDFDSLYRRHVDHVAAGDFESAMADMDQATVPGIFSGIRVPTAAVTLADIRLIDVQGERATGECVYSTDEGQIGLRSGWRLQSGTWLSDQLENFQP